MNLSEHFTLKEMTVSQAASRLGIRNEPNADQIKALRLLCEKVLEPVRAHFAAPVIVTSGFRSPRVNTAIKGSATSQHCRGEAADFHVHGVSDLDVAQYLLKHLNYDQLILEYPPNGWVHVSYSAHRTRNMELTAKRIKGRTVYLGGLRP